MYVKKIVDNEYSLYDIEKVLADLREALLKAENDNKDLLDGSHSVTVRLYLQSDPLKITKLR